MVRHEAKGVDQQRSLGDDVAEDREEAASVPIVKERPRAVHASGHDVVDGPGIFDSRRSWHIL